MFLKGTPFVLCVEFIFLNGDLSSVSAGKFYKLNVNKQPNTGFVFLSIQSRDVHSPQYRQQMTPLRVRNTVMCSLHSQLSDWTVKKQQQSDEVLLLLTLFSSPISMFLASFSLQMQHTLLILFPLFYSKCCCTWKEVDTRYIHCSH